MDGELMGGNENPMYENEDSDDVEDLTDLVHWLEMGSLSQPQVPWFGVNAVSEGKGKRQGQLQL